jgi:hypothetical protein
MLEEDEPIYRGDRNAGFKDQLDKHGFALVDTSATERQSQNTSNYYTVILDNMPGREDFPKRSRSFICSTNQERSLSYASYDPARLLRVIPFDGVKIGAVNRGDMWDTEIKLYDDTQDIETWNDVFAHARLEEKWSSFVEFDAQLKRNDEKAVAAFDRAFGDYPHNDFLKRLIAAYSPKETGHTAHTTKNLKDAKRGEVWVGGKCVLISNSMWAKLRKALKK